MNALNAKEAESAHMVEGCQWVPEYGAWMVRCVVVVVVLLSSLL